MASHVVESRENSSCFQNDRNVWPKLKWYGKWHGKHFRISSREEEFSKKTNVVKSVIDSAYDPNRYLYSLPQSSGIKAILFMFIVVLQGGDIS